MNRVQNYSILLQMDQSRFKNGDMVYCIDEEQIYFYNEGWSLLQATANDSGLTMSLYDLNKSIIPQLDPIADFTSVISRVNKWQADTCQTFYMLYGKEISYFTVFFVDSDPFHRNCNKLGENLIDCLRSIGATYSIELNEDNVWEIWADWDGEATCLYLFPYDNGVVFIND